jgi:hypothetical protein
MYDFHFFTLIGPSKRTECTHCSFFSLRENGVYAQLFLQAQRERSVRTGLSSGSERTECTHWSFFSLRENGVYAHLFFQAQRERSVRTALSSGSENMEQPQDHALDRSVTEIGTSFLLKTLYLCVCVCVYTHVENKEKNFFFCFLCMVLGEYLELNGRKGRQLWITRNYAIIL